MKTFSLSLNVLLLAAVVIMTWNACQKKAESCGICGNYSASENPPGAISADLLTRLTGSYAQDDCKRMVSRNGNLSDESDALALVFSLEQLKNLIWHIENTACSTGCFGKTTYGIRFYYIKYSPEAMLNNPGLSEQERNKLKDLYTKYPDRHSLAMVPVYYANGDWYDFDYKSDCQRIDPGRGDKAAAAFLPVSGDNHGNLAPPPQGFHYPHTLD